MLASSQALFARVLISEDELAACMSTFRILVENGDLRLDAIYRIAVDPHERLLQLGADLQTGKFIPS